MSTDITELTPDLATAQVITAEIATGGAGGALAPVADQPAVGPVIGAIDKTPTILPDQEPTNGQ